MVLIDGTLVKVGEKVVVIETEKDGEGNSSKIPVFVEGKYSLQTGDFVLVECFSAWRRKQLGNEIVFELNFTATKLSVAKGDKWVELTPVASKPRHNKR